LCENRLLTPGNGWNMTQKSESGKLRHKRIGSIVAEINLGVFA
jgi:hypothetical protein